MFLPQNMCWQEGISQPHLWTCNRAWSPWNVSHAEIWSVFNTKHVQDASITRKLPIFNQTLYFWLLSPTMSINSYSLIINKSSKYITWIYPLCIYLFFSFCFIFVIEERDEFEDWRYSSRKHSRLQSSLRFCLFLMLFTLTLFC